MRLTFPSCRTKKSSFRPKTPLSNKGFSLLEVLLAVTIAISLGSMHLGQIKRETESIQAKAVGEQLKMVGSALNSYVTLHYNQITAMTSVAAPGTADDPGPRTCNAGTGLCTVTSDTLRRNGLLPNSFSGRNAYGATYEYYIRVTGTSPNWQVDGLVVTSDPYTVGAIPRFDLIGQAMTVAGADSGTTRTVGNRMDGFNGSWQETQYPINQVGLLGYRVGYGTSGFTSYLRIDGANYMTNHLRLGDSADTATFRNIENVRDITSTGTYTGSKINLTSPTADAITMTSGTIGASGGNTLIRSGGLQVMNGAGTAVAPIEAGNANLGTVTSTGDGSFAGNLQGASLTTTTGNITSAGNITANTNIVAGGNISTINGNISTTNGNISAGGNITSSTLNVANSSFTNNDWSMGSGANAGGWYMSDTTWMRVKNDKSIITAGEIRGGTIRSTGEVIANTYLRISGAQAEGTACGAGVGAFARNAAGRLVQCVAGTWTLASGVNSVTTANSGTCQAGGICDAVCPAGYKMTGGGYLLVFRPTVNDPAAPASSEAIAASNTWRVRSVSGSNSQFQAQVTCVN